MASVTKKTMHPSCIALWCRILHRVGDSKLLLKATQFVDEWVRDKFKEQFAIHGISSDRLIFEGPSSPKEKFLQVFGMIDILLDSFPHNGGTTTHDALSMGVAAITLTGDVYVKRFGYQIMMLSGNEKFVAGSLNEYVEIAAQFADTAGESQATRIARRKRFLTSALTDSERYIESIENAFRLGWQSKCQQVADLDA